MDGDSQSSDPMPAEISIPVSVSPKTSVVVRVVHLDAEPAFRAVEVQDAWTDREVTTEAMAQLVPSQNRPQALLRQ